MSRLPRSRGLFSVCFALLLTALFLSSNAFAASVISGLVLNSQSVPYVGCSVALYSGTSQTPTATTTTISNGRYYFTELADGTWTVKPGKDGTTFSPLYRTYTVATSTITDANFTGTDTATGAISGVIKDSGGVVMVSCSVGLYAGTSATATSTTTTNADGRYYFTGIAAGSWTVKPAKDGTTFSPVYRTYTLPQTVTTADFTGTASTTSAISGVVKDSGGVVMVGVSVGLYAGTSATATATTTTNADGRYYFTGLAAGSWTVRPGKDGTTFSPLYRTYTLPPTVSVADFTGTATTSAISGVIKDSGGVAMVGVSVGLYAGTSATATATTTTNADGRYYFTGLAAGSWTAKPGKDGTTFSPLYRTYTLPPTISVADFTGTATTSVISGVIKDSGGAVMVGVSVGLYAGTSATATATTTTNADGRYYFTGLAAGSWTAKPGKDGTTFSPLYRTYTLPPTVSIADFTGSTTPTGSFISGLVKTATGVAMSGVSVGLYQNDQLLTSTTTNADGRYYLINLVPGTYVVRPSQASVTFDPLYKSVTVPPSITTVNFSVAVPTSTISGLIKDTGGLAMTGVSVGLYLSDVLKQTVTTNSEGRYTFSSVAAGAYVVRPAKDGSVFDPLYRAVTAPPGTTSANFTGAVKPVVPTLREGAVTPTTGNTKTLFTFTVIYTDAGNRAPTSSYVCVDGRFYGMVKYDATDVTYTDGCRYIYKLMLATGSHQYRFAFNGGGTVIKLPGPTETDYYTGPSVSGDLYYLSGVIATPESRLAGVTVTITRDGMDPMVVQTNAEGRYYSLALPPGVYTVTPNKPGFIFDPPYRATVLPPSNLSCNFYATAQ